MESEEYDRQNTPKKHYWKIDPEKNGTQGKNFLMKKDTFEGRGLYIEVQRDGKCIIGSYQDTTYYPIAEATSDNYDEAFNNFIEKTNITNIIMDLIEAQVLVNKINSKLNNL